MTGDVLVVGGCWHESRRVEDGRDEVEVVYCIYIDTVLAELI